MIVRRKTTAYIQRSMVFVLEINKRPILAFEAFSGMDSKQLLHEPWLHEDLKRLRSNGEPLWDGRAKLKVGVAAGAQVAEATASLRAATKGDEMAVVYLDAPRQRLICRRN